MSHMELIRTRIPEAARLEQLAEEAVELSHAALKLARILRNENPTPVDEWVARHSLMEEYTDTHVAAMAAEVMADSNLGAKKIARWADRISEWHKAGEQQ
jgi:hypothetical protein